MDNKISGLTKMDHKRCASCSELITDPYVYEVDGRLWHENCLRCSMCLSILDPNLKCFMRDNQFFCREDFVNTFFIKCSKCNRKIASEDWIRKAKNHVFHLACFSCDSCDRQLSTGEDFAYIDDQIWCREHYLESIEMETSSSDDYNMGDDSSKKKIKRVRTAFTEDQLEVLQTNFEMDSNPDGQDLERIAINAGLSKRVTQVWFQNARARQKKHSYYGKRKTPYEINVHLRTNVLL